MKAKTDTFECTVKSNVRTSVFFFTRTGKIFYPSAGRRVKILPGRRPTGKKFTRPQAGARNFTRPEAGGRKYLAGWELF